MNEEQEFLNPKEQEEAERLAHLIGGHIKGTLTPDQEQELNDWLEASEDNIALFEKMTDEKNIDKALKLYQSFDAAKAYEKFQSRIGKTEDRKSAPKTFLRTLAIAASLVFVAVSIYLLVKQQPPGNGAHVITAVQTLTDILPPSNGVILTKGNGTKISLDTLQANLLQEGSASMKLNDAKELSYSPGSINSLIYNRIDVPAGTTYHLTLSDGSKVWLNTGSSIRYPVAFTDHERLVEVTGEVYFEVTHKADRQPFIVSILDKENTEKGRVEVLGTHFNVNAYDNESSVNTSLFEGSVKFNDAILKPGQQGALINGRIGISTDMKADQVMAWKNGEFIFRNETIETIMRQVARWYDVDITYLDKVDFHFYATVPRHTGISKLLHLLELTNNIHFKITSNPKEGKKGTIIVMK